MDPADILRFADVVHRDRGIEKEIVFSAIEQGMLTAARKRFGEDAVIECRLDRRTGEIDCLVNGQKRSVEFGRIAAQTARQVMNQRIREAERDKHLDEYNRRLNSIVTGSIQRIESGNLIVNMGRVEGIVPRSEQIRGETFKVGDRIRAFLFEVRPMGQRVRIVLSRSRPDFVAKLFELEVPEIADGVIVVRRIEREAGYKTKLAVESLDTKVDPIGACVGVRGSRIRNIIDELNGEKVDILKFEEQPEMMIATALKPAQINSITLNWDTHVADVLVDEDQLSLAIGRRGANVRLASRLADWEINIAGEPLGDVPGEQPAEGAEAGDGSEAAEGEEPAAAAEAESEGAAEAPEAPAADAEAPAAEAEAPAAEAEAPPVPGDDEPDAESAKESPAGS
ncbi:MAG: transcription termination factor NusA [Planctomycetota bacterium]|nr:transcription termination factor NusA [Planctomycetota bacterium]